MTYDAKKALLYALFLFCMAAAVLPGLYCGLYMLWHALLVPAGQHLLSASEHCLVKQMLCAGMVWSALHSPRGGP
jgi:hypothetical protein